ncbi:hypothetical protein [Falsiroseomonas sp.]|uniref:hypothetical protein n=1 Tax=Falsiroseomonas sp. TaxID=2870721 RepID=UPI003568562A
MAQDEKGRKGGASTGSEAKTARPTSVGPHHVRDKQEDPGNPGIRPEEGYGAEIARNDEAARQGPGGGPIAPSPKTETADESGGTEEMLRKAGAPRSTPPLTGTTKE